MCPVLATVRADESPDQRYHCANCGKDITLRLKCAECQDCDLCLDVRMLVLCTSLFRYSH